MIITDEPTILSFEIVKDYPIDINDEELKKEISIHIGEYFLKYYDDIPVTYELSEDNKRLSVILKVT